MERKEELLKLVSDQLKAERLVNEIVFLEGQLEELKKLTFINVNPKNPMQQKATPASKQYKEMLQQYNNLLRLLYHLSGDLGSEQEEESPLREWLKNREIFENAHSGKKDMDAG